MISLEKFAERCGNLIKQNVPFIAYWHDHGCGLLRTDEQRRPVYIVQVQNCHPEKFLDLEKRNDYIAKASQQGKAFRTWEKMAKLKAAKTTITGFRRAIDKMKKDPRTRGSLCTVEYDGHGYSIEGDGLADLIGAMGL